VKKKYLLTLLLVIFILANVPGTVLASPNVVLNGTKLYFNTPPVIENGRTLVPLRTIFEFLGAVVSWDEKSQTVTAVKNNTTIKLEIGASTATKNDEVVNLEVPAKIVDGSTLVPLRFISESMGCKVEWADETQTVVITDNNDPNSKLIVYSDPKGRFAVSYPNDWYIQTKNLVEKTDLIIFPNPKDIKLNGYTPLMSIYTIDISNYENMNLDVIKSSSYKIIKSMYNDAEIISDSDIVIDGLPGSVIDYSVTISGKSWIIKDIYIYNESFLYEIGIGVLKGESQSLSDKFIDVAKSIKTIDLVGPYQPD